MKWRSYQEHILSAFETMIANKKTSFHLVAPPGSGKTLLGLEMIRRLGKKAVILSPTGVIQHQWISELPLITDSLSISVRPEDDPDILSLTYQSFSVKTPGKEELHPNSQKLLALLAHRPVLILDECHHLTAWWAKTVKKVMQTHHPMIIGLTATPPLDREADAWNHYLDILGDPDLEVPLPSVVKEGFLAPYQDLAYLTQPTKEEILIIHEKQRAFDELLNLFEVPPHPLPSLHNWARDSWEAQGILNLRGMNDFQESLYRYLIWRGEALGFSNHEIRLRLAGSDWLVLFNQYIEDHKEKNLPGQFLQDLQQVSAIAGLDGLPGHFSPGRESIGRILEFSPGKAQAAGEILSKEAIQLGKELRALVITDFDKGHEGSGSSAEEVFKALLAKTQTNALDPVLISGKRLLVDTDVAPVFLESAREFCLRQGWDLPLELEAQGEYSQLHCDSSNWTVGRWTLLASAFFERGLTRCLVGTRSVLGEGWNSLKLNTLIDLTLTKSFVSTNQIRGRVLRLDPDNSLKLANIWEVITLGPGFWEAEADLVRMERKYSHFYGPGADGLLERGLGHLHPLLVFGSVQELQNQAPRLNEVMTHRSTKRWEAYEKWKVGTPCEGRQSHCLDVKIETELDKGLIPYGNVGNGPLYKIAPYVSSLGSGALVMLLIPPEVGIFLPSLILGVFLSWGVGKVIAEKWIRPFTLRRTFEKYKGTFKILKGLCQVALWNHNLKNRFEFTRLDENLWRIRNPQCPEALMDLKDLIAPSGKTRYLGTVYLFSEDIVQTMNPMLKIGVPQHWGKDAKSAYAFAVKWEENFRSYLTFWYQKGIIPKYTDPIPAPWKVYIKDLWL